METVLSVGAQSLGQVPIQTQVILWQKRCLFLLQLGHLIPDLLYDLCQRLRIHSTFTQLYANVQLFVRELGI